MSKQWQETDLHADGAAAPAAVLALRHRHRAAAQGVEAQDPSHAVADDAHLQADTHPS